MHLTFLQPNKPLLKTFILKKALFMNVRRQHAHLQVSVPPLFYYVSFCVCCRFRLFPGIRPSTRRPSTDVGEPLHSKRDLRHVAAFGAFSTAGSEAGRCLSGERLPQPRSVQKSLHLTLQTPPAPSCPLGSQVDVNLWSCGRFDAFGVFPPPSTRAVFHPRHRPCSMFTCL